MRGLVSLLISSEGDILPQAAAISKQLIHSRRKPVQQACEEECNEETWIFNFDEAAFRRITGTHPGVREK
jgi:hypothetical protein